MTPAELLIAAKALIATPETWTQGTTARDQSGKPCDATDDDARCFCSYGALYLAAGRRFPEDTMEFTVALRALDTAAVTVGGRLGLWDIVEIVHLNDHEKTTHGTVMAAFSEAIKSLEAA